MKKIICIIIVLLLTGCEIDYNLDIKYENKTVVFKEEINYLGNKNNNEFKNRIDITMNWPYPAINDVAMDYEEPTNEPDERYYKYELIDENDKYGMKFKYNFNQTEMAKAYSWDYCYLHYDYIAKGNLITMSTSTEFMCFADFEILENINMNIRTPFKVDLHNADKVTDNANYMTYTWNINRSNANNKSIYFRFFNNLYFNDEDPSLDDIEEKPIINTYIVISIVLAFLLFLIYYIFIQKNKKNNEI